MIVVVVVILQGLYGGSGVYGDPGQDGDRVNTVIDACSGLPLILGVVPSASGLHSLLNPGPCSSRDMSKCPN